MPKKVLTRLRIDEGSHVDRGAGEGVTVKLIKKDKKQPFEGVQKPFGDTEDSDEEKAKRLVKLGAKSGKVDGKSPNLKDNDEALGGKDGDSGDGFDGDGDCDMGKGWTPYWKREFTSEQRRTMAHNGQAMAGGGYPIADRADLENAIQAIGRAKKPNKTKEHIMSRARALGCTDCIPDKWMQKSTTKAIAKAQALVVDIFKDGQDEAASFNEVMADIHDSGSIEKLEEDVHSAVHALKDSLSSINKDEGVGDKMSAARESMQEFVDHVTALLPSDVAKAWKERAMKKTMHTSVDANDTMDRRSEIKDKGKIVTIESEGDGEEDVNQPDNKETGATAKVWKSRYDSLVAMDPTHVGYLRHPDNLMDGDEVRAFVDMGKADRAKWIEENPIGQMTEKRMAGLPEPLRKQLEAGARAAAALEKREEAELTTSLEKRARDVHIFAMDSESAKQLNESMVKLHKADSESFDAVMKAVETMFKAASAQDRTNFILKEFGNSQGSSGDTGSGSAHDQLMRKAEQHRDAMEKIGKAFTIEQAYAAVCEKSENNQLFQMAKREGSVAA